MKVSIITIVWNNLANIKETMDSVLNQTYDNIEYIVIDGGSTDGTKELISNDYKNQLTCFVSEKDNGIYDAMNKGLSLATGDIIGFVNADDIIYHTDGIEKIVEKFTKTESEVVYGDKIYVAPNDPDKVVRFWRAGPFKRENYKKGWMTPHLSTYIKRDLYEKYGHFRTDFKIGADYELMFRFIYKNKAKTTYLPYTIARMRAGGVSNNSISNIALSNYEVYKSWKVNGYNVSPFIMFRKPFRKILQLIQKEK